MDSLSAKELQAENGRLQSSLKSLRTNLHSLEVTVREKSSRIEHLENVLESERTRHEEEIVSLRMKQEHSQGTDSGEAKERDLVACRAAVAAAEEQRAALAAEVSVLQEAKAADVRRVEMLENDLQSCRDKLREMERNCGASSLLRAEQEALLVSLRKDLVGALTAKEESLKKVRELEQTRSKAEGQLARLMEHKERLEVAEAQLEESRALTKRLQAQLQTVETNYATKTALLAAAEASCEELQSQLRDKEAGLDEVVERMTVLQTQMAEAEAKLLEQSAANARLREDSERHSEDLKALHAAALQSEVGRRDKALADAQQEFAKKSAAARAILGEKEEELRLLKAKVDELKDEIASGECIGGTVCWSVEQMDWHTVKLIS